MNNIGKIAPRLIAEQQKKIILTPYSDYNAGYGVFLYILL